MKQSFVWIKKFLITYIFFFIAVICVGIVLGIKGIIPENVWYDIIEPITEFGMNIAAIIVSIRGLMEHKYVGLSTTCLVIASILTLATLISEAILWT